MKSKFSLFVLLILLLGLVSCAVQPGSPSSAPGAPSSGGAKLVNFNDIKDNVYLVLQSIFSVKYDKSNPQEAVDSLTLRLRVLFAMLLFFVLYGVSKAVLKDFSKNLRIALCITISLLSVLLIPSGVLATLSLAYGGVFVMLLAGLVILGAIWLIYGMFTGQTVVDYAAKAFISFIAGAFIMTFVNYPVDDLTKALNMGSALHIPGFVDYTFSMMYLAGALFYLAAAYYLIQFLFHVLSKNPEHWAVHPVEDRGGFLKAVGVGGSGEKSSISRAGGSVISAVRSVRANLRRGNAHVDFVRATTQLITYLDDLEALLNAYRVSGHAVPRPLLTLVSNMHRTSNTLAAAPAPGGGNIDPAFITAHEAGVSDLETAVSSLRSQIAAL